MPRNVVAQITISGKSGPQLTPGIEQHFVDRVAVGGQLKGQGVQRDIVEHDGDEDLPLPRGELVIHRPAHRGEQIPPLGLLSRVEAEPAGQPVPVLGVQRHGRVAPEVPPELGRHLEDDEFAGPGGELALAAELAELAGDGQQRVRRGLVGHIVQFGAGDGQPRPAPGGLAPRDPHQQSMQPCQRRLPPRARTRPAPQPLGRLSIGPGSSGRGSHEPCRFPDTITMLPSDATQAPADVAPGASLAHSQHRFRRRTTPGTGRDQYLTGKTATGAAANGA